MTYWQLLKAIEKAKDLEKELEEARANYSKNHYLCFRESLGDRILLAERRLDDEIEEFQSLVLSK